MPYARDSLPDDPDHRTSWTRQIKPLSIILRAEFGIPFRLYEPGTGAPVAGPARDEGPAPSPPPLEPIPADEGASATRRLAQGGDWVNPLGGGRFQIALPFPEADRPSLIAVGVFLGLSRTPAESAIEQARLGKWVRSVHDRLRLASQSAGRHRHEPGYGYPRQEPARGSEPETAGLVGLEALMGLERLLRNLRIDKTPEHNREQVLRTAREVLQARSLLWVPAEGDEAVIEGEPLVSRWDCGQFVRLLIQDPGGAKQGYLINNRVQANSWGARFPNVVSLLAVPLAENVGTGWVIALNRRSGASPGSSTWPPVPGATGHARFRRTDAALLLPFAALLGVHLRASRRHQHFKGVLDDLTRSLAAALEAHGEPAPHGPSD